LKVHEERRCTKRLPLVYRIAYPFARRQIEEHGFDRRKNESRIYEYAILRYYVDRIELMLAAVFLVGRIYLTLPLSRWTGLDLPLAGVSPLGWSDSAVILIAALTIITRRQLLTDYRRNVVQRIKKISR
jgi:hypothetical protein